MNAGSHIPAPREASDPAGAPGVRLRRSGQPALRHSGGRTAPGWLLPLLRVPLRIKLCGATVLVSLVLLATVVQQTSGVEQERLIVVLAVALAFLLAINLYLVSLALRPLGEIEETAARVWRGDLDARVIPSPLADRDMIRLGGTLNLLLDSLLEERARMREMARRIIDAQDDERARIARELHDSTAQTLTALTLQLSAFARDVTDPALLERRDLVRSLAQTALEEVRTLAVSVYPRVLDDLGLPAALDWLGRQLREHGEFEVSVSTDTDGVRLHRTTSAAIYRVAQEASRNAQRHARASAVRLSLFIADDAAVLEVEDDGIGFDVAEAEARRPGMGMFAMRERIELVGGTVQVIAGAGSGTLVRASVPVQSSGGS